MPYPPCLLSILLAALLFAGCADEVPQGNLPGTTSDTALSGTTAPPASDSALALDSANNGAVTGGISSPVPATTRTALVDSVRSFMTAVESGSTEKFWQMLSERSLRAVGTQSGGTREQIWQAARETLTGIDRPTVSFLGGTDDSVSLIVSRTTYVVIDSVRTDTLEDPVIIHFLREKGAWKAIYPGLLYPERDRWRR